MGKMAIPFERSFASHEKAKYWSLKNKLKPNELFKSSGKKCWFNCDCGHEFESSLNSINRNNRWCSYCSNPPQKLCDNNNCTHCFNKSFASSSKVKYWSDKNKISARYAFLHTHSKYLFICDNSHEFYIALCNVCDGRWCPICKNKGEHKLYDTLSNHHVLKQQFRAKWCKDKKILSFDFLIEDLRIIIELDGEQHFKQVGKWKSPEEQQKRDKHKTKCANENNYSVIHVLWDDVYFDKNEWLDSLLTAIDKIANDKIVQNIYICSNNEYDVYLN